MPANYYGVPIFGRTFEFQTQENPRDEQRIAAPGLDGTGALDMGDRGRITKVEGLLFATDGATFIANVELFRSYKDGVPRPMEDTMGRIWPYVKLHRFVPRGRVGFDPYYGFYTLYTAEFTHIG